MSRLFGLTLLEAEITEQRQQSCQGKALTIIVIIIITIITTINLEDHKTGRKTVCLTSQLTPTDLLGSISDLCLTVSSSHLSCIIFIVSNLLLMASPT